MRILHVGFGFRPWIVNGLVIYSEAVMEGQVRGGHEVGYFFGGRQLPFLRRPFLHRWERHGVRMFEWVNGSLIVGRHRGTPEPEDDVHHPPEEAAFRQVLRRFAPDVIHVHDLGGLPSSILDTGRPTGVPTVMTIHDYQPLCPTVKLYDADDRICLRRDPGEMCAVCCADAPVDNREDLERTLADARRRLRRALPPLDAALRRPETERVGIAGIRMMESIAGLRGPGSGSTPHGPGPTPQAPGPRARERSPRAPGHLYQRRRDVNVERLSRLDALIAGSERSAVIYRTLGVAPARIRVVAVNPPHIERLRPRRSAWGAPGGGAPGGGAPLRFAVLNAANSTQKGADLIVAALALLSQRRLDGRYRLSVHGAVAPHVQPALARHPSVDLHGDYAVEDLDRLLEPVDVGIFPSVWEEVYGFAGLEFLAKGIPVIGNDIGAIAEYVRPGQTGWLNRSGSAAELADLMAAAIRDPGEARRLGQTAIGLRGELMAPFASGLAELTALYEELLGRR